MAGISNLKPFKPGYDSRRGVKPKGAKHLSTYIKEALEDEEFEVWLTHPTKGIVEFKGMPIKAIIMTAVQRAVNGDDKAREWLAKYAYGTKVDITSDGKALPTPVIDLTSMKDE